MELSARNPIRSSLYISSKIHCRNLRFARSEIWQISNTYFGAKNAFKLAKINTIASSHLRQNRLVNFAFPSGSKRFKPPFAKPNEILSFSFDSKKFAYTRNIQRVHKVSLQLKKFITKASEKTDRWKLLQNETYIFKFSLPHLIHLYMGTISCTKHIKTILDFLHDRCFPQMFLVVHCSDL